MIKQAPLKKGRPRIGRPPLSPEEVRSNRIVTFVTNVEMAKLERKADQERVSLSSVIHQILSKYLKEA